MSFDFDAAVTTPFRMQPGLRKLATGRLHLTPAAAGSRHQREKLAVLSAFADDAMVCLPGFDAAPALHTLASQAAREHPQAWGWDGHTARALGVAVAEGQIDHQSAGPFGLGDEVSRCLLGLHPSWRLAGLLSLAFEEDFAVIDASSGMGTLPWLAVTLPSRWAPQSKVGLPFAQVHAPVADNGLLVRAAGELMRLVTGPVRWERFVWNVTAHPRLHAHPDRVDRAGWDGRFEPGQAWWRTERQTFIPLPAQRQAVFTIGVQVGPLASAFTPEQARRLHQAVSTMSDAVLAYRGLEAVRQPLLAWLDEQAPAASANP